MWRIGGGDKFLGDFLRLEYWYLIPLYKVRRLLKRKRS